MAILEEGKVSLKKEEQAFMARGDYKIVQRMEENAYEIELPVDMNISATFNIRASLSTLRMEMRVLKI